MSKARLASPSAEALLPGGARRFYFGLWILDGARGIV